MSSSEKDAGLREGKVPRDLSPDVSSDALFTSSLRRVERLIPAIAVAVSLVLGFRNGWLVALGFLAGAAVAYVNFRWLKSTVAALSDAITQTGPPRSKPSVVLRFITRFVLIALGAYVIFVSYPLAFRGFLGGLFVPVPAILMEGAYLVYLADQPGL